MEIKIININFVNYPHSKEPIASKLDTSATLEKIREELSQCEENGESIMEFDMKFCNKGGPYVIQRSKEAAFCLHEILDNNNNLYIKRSEKFEDIMPRLIKEKKLDCGIRWTERGPMQSDNVAFKFDRREFVTHRTDDRLKFEKSSKELCENGIVWKLDLNMPWLPFTGSIRTHFTRKRSNKVAHKSCQTLERYSRVTLFMKREHIKPSDEFRDDVERVLKSSSQKEKMRDALNEVCEKYGFFWARTVQLGGLIIKNEEEHKETNVNIKSTGGTIGISAASGTAPMVDGGIKRNNQNLTSNSNKNCRAVGGFEPAYKHETDTEEWLETLEDYFTWTIVDYGDVVPIFEIFEESTRTAILKVLGPRICYHGIDELKPLRYPLVRPLKIHSDIWKGISQHQIFAEVICDNENDAIFAVSIEQIPNGPPKVYVSKVREISSFSFKKFFGKNYTLKIAYIITGYPQSFSQTVDELPVEVAVVKGEKRDDKFIASLPKMPNIQGFNQRVVLVTCYVTQQTMEGNYTIFPVHLHKDDTNTNITEICISAYGRNNNGFYKINIENLPQECIKIAYCIIPDNRQNGESKFELEKTKIIPHEAAAYKALFSNQSVFTSIVFPLNQCFPVFKLTNKHILCCSDTECDILEGSFIYFHRENDNTCVRIK